MAGSFTEVAARVWFSRCTQGGDAGTSTHILDPVCPAKTSILAVLPAPGPALRRLVLPCPPDGPSGRVCTGQAAAPTVLL